MKFFKKTEPAPLKWQTLRFNAWLDDKPVTVKLQVNFDVVGKVLIRLKSDSDYRLKLDDRCFEIEDTNNHIKQQQKETKHT